LAVDNIRVEESYACLGHRYFVEVQNAELGQCFDVDLQVLVGSVEVNDVECGVGEVNTLVELYNEWFEESNWRLVINWLDVEVEAVGWGVVDAITDVEYEEVGFGLFVLVVVLDVADGLACD